MAAGSPATPVSEWEDVSPASEWEDVAPASTPPVKQSSLPGQFIRPAAPRSLLQRVGDVFSQGALGDLFQSHAPDPVKVAIDKSRQDFAEKPVLRLSALDTPTEAKDAVEGARKGLLEGVESWTSPQGVGLMVGIGKLGKVGSAGRAAVAALGSGFDIGMIESAVHEVPEAKALWEKGNKGEAARIAVKSLLTFGLGAYGAGKKVSGMGGAPRIGERAPAEPIAEKQAKVPREEPTSTTDISEWEDVTPRTTEETHAPTPERSAESAPSEAEVEGIRQFQFQPETTPTGYEPIPMEPSEAKAADPVAARREELAAQFADVSYDKLEPEERGEVDRIIHEDAESTRRLAEVAPEVAAPPAAETALPAETPVAAEVAAPEPVEQPTAPQQTVQENVDRMESLKPETAETLAPGSTRELTLKDGTKFREKLAEIPVDQIAGNPDNKLYEEKVHEYVDKPSPVAVELRELPEGGYIVHDGHHRMEAALRRGEMTVRAWVPVDEAKAPADAALADLSDKELRKEEKTAIKAEDPERMDEVRGEIADRGAEKIAEPAPGEIYPIDPKEISTDPQRFQFKSDAIGKGGTTDKLRDVTEWNPRAAGVISIWRDPADGKTYVTNGHHRLELAQRLNVPQVNVQRIEAPDAITARGIAALDNVMEGNGSAIDAAKVFRDLNLTDEDLAARGIALKGAIARDATGLRDLTPEVFDPVARGEFDAKNAATIGRMIKNPADQIAAAKLIERGESSGKTLKPSEVERLIRMAQGAEKGVETQDTLFGEQSEERNYAVEQAQLADWISKQIAKEKRLFSTVGDEGAAERLSSAGNVIKAADNAAVARQAAQAAELFEKMYDRSGPVADALREGAGKLGRGENANAVRKETYERVHEAIAGLFWRQEGRAEATGRIAEEQGGEAAPGVDRGELPGSPGGSATEPTPAVSGSSQSNLFSAKLDAAESRIKSRIAQRWKDLGSTLQAGPGMAAEQVFDYAAMGAVKIAKGAVKFKDWSAQMIAEFGDAIQPHLGRIWIKARELHKANLAPSTEEARSTRGLAEETEAPAAPQGKTQPRAEQPPAPKAVQAGQGPTTSPSYDVTKPNILKNVSPAVSAALDQRLTDFEARNPGRKVVTFDEIRAEARNLDPAIVGQLDVKKMKAGETLDPAVRFAARETLNGLQEEIQSRTDRLSKEGGNMSPDERDRQQSVLASMEKDARRLVDVLIPTRSQDGRNLAYHRMMAERSFDATYWLGRAKKALAIPENGELPEDVRKPVEQAAARGRAAEKNAVDSVVKETTTKRVRAEAEKEVADAEVLNRAAIVRQRYKRLVSSLEGAIKGEETHKAEPVTPEEKEAWEKEPEILRLRAKLAEIREEKRVAKGIESPDREQVVEDALKRKISSLEAALKKEHTSTADPIKPEELEAFNDDPEVKRLKAELEQVRAEKKAAKGQPDREAVVEKLRKEFVGRLKRQAAGEQISATPVRPEEKAAWESDPEVLGLRAKIAEERAKRIPVLPDTAEKQARYKKAVLDRIAEKMRGEKKEPTPSKWALTPEERAQVDKDPEVRAARVALARQVAKLERNGWRDYFLSMRASGLLTAMGTHVRNITSNAAFQLYSEAARLPAMIPDAILSATRKGSGGRTVQPPSVKATFRASQEGAIKGFQEAKEIWKTGQVPDEGTDLIDVSRELNAKHLFQGPILKNLGWTVDAINHVFRALKAEDRFFKRYAFRRSVEEQMKTSGAKQPTEEMLVQAWTDADFQTFNNKNMLASELNSALNRMEQHGATGKAVSTAVKFFLPFRNTPANLWVRALENTGAGVITGAVKAFAHEGKLNDAQQRAISMEIGRGALGAGILMAGFFAAKNGWATGMTSGRDKGQRDTQQAAGRQDGAIKVGDKWYSILGLSPIANSFVIGATLGRKYDQLGDFFTNPEDAAAIATATIKEQPMLKGLQDIVEAVDEGGGQVAASAAGSMVPSIVSEVGDLTDAARRDSRANTLGGRIESGIKARVPGLRETLPEKVDIFGETVPQDRLASTLGFPATQDKTGDAVLKELVDLKADISTSPKHKTETDDSYRDRLRREGVAIKYYVGNVMRTAKYRAETDDGKVKLLKHEISRARAAIK